MNGRTVRFSGEWTVRSSGGWKDRPIFRSEKPEHDDVLPRVLYLKAIDNMNGADSWGREEKRRRRNEKDREARVRETPKEREARLAGGDIGTGS